MKQTIVMDKPGKRDLTIVFDKEKEEKEIVGIIRATEPGDYNLNVVIDHKAGKSLGRVTIKGIARNGARVAVTGLIKIREGANGVDDFLRIAILLLDDVSTATAEPRLEIEANDVKASHAATIGKIDEEQLFYLMSRGMMRGQAEKLIVDGFLGDVIRKSDPVTR